MAADRVYAVEDEESITMVIAAGQTQAFNHVVKGKFKVRVASAMDVAEYMQAGGIVERAGKADGPPEEGNDAEMPQP